LTQTFLDQAEGKALKNIAFSSLGKEKKGEAVITHTGIEGGAIYALSPQIRKQLADQGSAEVFLDLKPAFTLAEVKNKVEGGRGTKSWTKHLEDQLRLDKIKIALLKEILSKDEFMIPSRVAEKIKKLPLHIHSLAPLDEAISTVGGVSLQAIDSHFQLKAMPGNYVIGEMLDWDAPTGGYLLQGCFSMGNALGKYLNTSVFYPKV
jgi:predicted flavoprotein YhiN